jgi:uncharacterized protein YlzI (FlbEa/FlbD family)
MELRTLQFFSDGEQLRSRQMIRLTNADASYEGRPIALNPAHIVSVFEATDTERRVQTLDGQQYLVTQSYDEILSAIAAWRGTYTQTSGT